MEKKKGFDEEKAISKGIFLMKSSKDPVHDIRHAENVAEHSLKIYSSLKNSGWDCDGIDENLILLCAFWHDCFKAGCEVKTFFNEVFEGVRSAEIVGRELSGLVEEERLSLVLKAIRNHNNVFFVLFSGKRLDILTRILVEADALDAKNPERKKLRESSRRSMFHRFVVFFGEPVVEIMQKIYIKSDYAKCHLRSMNNKKKQ